MTMGAHAHADHGAGHQHHHHEESFVSKYVFSQDHKMIGKQFLVTAIIMAWIAVIMSVMFRLQLAWPGEGFAFTSAAQSVVAVQALASGAVPPSRATSGLARLPAGLRLVLEPEALRGAHVLVVSRSSRGNAVAALFQQV